MPSPKVLKLIPGQAFIRGNSGPIAIMVIALDHLPYHLHSHLQTGRLAALELNCLV